MTQSWSSLFLALSCASLLLSLTSLQVQATPLNVDLYNRQGSLEARQDAANSSDPFAAYRNPTYTQEDLDSLWALLEDKKPVIKANITEVTPRPSQDSIYVPPDPAQRTTILGLSSAYEWPPSGQGCNKDAGLKFPSNFRWGVATAAFQVEGAAKADGKAPSNWDMCRHYIPSCIANNDTGDVADNHYYQYKEDLARLKKMGGKIYSFSFSWSRIFPFGNGPVNEDGLKHYDDVINEALEQGLEPVATLHHWDTPLSLEFQYGSFRDARIVDDYVRYANTVLRRFGDRVKTWVTFNEPNQICSAYQSGYPYNSTYNGDLSPQQGLFYCAKNLFLANGKTHKLYHELIKNGTIAKGEMAFKNDNSISLPHRTGNEEDIRAAERHDAVLLGLWSDPIRDRWSGNMTIYLSEVGFAEPFESSKTTLSQITLDAARARYVIDRLEEYLLAIHKDGLNLGGVFFWSLLDNLEWASGLDLRFGLQYVNYTTHGLDRHYKQSFLRIRDFFQAHT
ncbi:hypothetical protein NDA16_003409 [Ustilago loliicola]|nr:hypothetical protein NDA16_003409 [Ustilago loliicola]